MKDWNTVRKDVDDVSEGFVAFVRASYASMAAVSMAVILELLGTGAGESSPFFLKGALYVMAISLPLNVVGYIRVAFFPSTTALNIRAGVAISVAYSIFWLGLTSAIASMSMWAALLATASGLVCIAHCVIIMHIHMRSLGREIERAARHERQQLAEKKKEVTSRLTDSKTNTGA